MSNFTNLMLLLSLIALIEIKSSDAFIINPSRVKQISWKPRAFVYHGFLSDEECDHLISLAKAELKRSSVADNLSGESKLSDVRTSSGMFISKAEDPIVSGIEDKIATWTFLPKENGEAIQVLHYEHGQKYDPHFDYFADKVNIARGGHRIATVLMYHSDVEKGGETIFPNRLIPWPEDSPSRRSAEADEDLSECGRKGIAVKPRKGDALFFSSLLPTAIPDPMSLHGGCPVIKGEKWSATKWIHVDSFARLFYPLVTALTQTTIVGDGQNSGNVQRIRSIWSAVLTSLITAGGVAGHVNNTLNCSSSFLLSSSALASSPFCRKNLLSPHANFVVSHKLSAEIL